MKDGPDNKNRDKYDKIRHLVEVDDDILAVFSINSAANSPNMKELYIAKNANLDKNYIDSLVRILGLSQVVDVEKPQVSGIKQDKEDYNILGKIKWIVIEYDKIRILKIFEADKIIFVLVKSNTQLEHTVDNILGYYYDMDEIPKSLF
ncbi:hypothetical protein BH23THE1_BH23THE1_26120 [soil metagenome]